MLLRVLLFLLISCFSHSLLARVEYPVQLGDERVLIQIWQGKGKTFVHLHQNERTALKAAHAVRKKEGSSLLTLRHSGQRTISFHLKHQRYEFDPNRIFTERGIKLTLEQYSHYSPAAQAEVKKLAAAILTQLPAGKLIAVHNNQGYSMRDYLPGRLLEKDAEKLYFHPGQYYRNFCLVTKQAEFSRLKESGLNTVLQAKEVTDDGSLSVHYGEKNYINIEAGHNQLAEQIRMLETV